MSELVTPQAITHYLGGEGALGTMVRNRRQLARLTEEGIPFASVGHLLKELNITQREMAGLLGVNIRTLSRNKGSQARLDPGASDRAYRAARLLALATEVLGGLEPAQEWLHEPQRALGGETPLHLMAMGGSGPEEVEELLLRMEYGVYA
ncbi:type II RES/Xre toxin-antitoxin system antitoxin [Thiohalorhabdus sp.]|uniref:type II RES/Xre toxin-antitoxin system antitoxin n=1 Tax=Thiohalorhabdus sp. TaxID=3094134 RepID=UPI002FC39473